MKVEEAIQLIYAVCTFGDSQTIEILDRIIGGNVHDISADQAYNALKAFMSSSHTRTKIFHVLIKRIKENID